jgi:hypothetical protein
MLWSQDHRGAGYPVKFTMRHAAISLKGLRDYSRPPDQGFRDILHFSRWISKLGGSMVQLSSDALRISPKYASTDWLELSVADSGDWDKAVEIVRNRLIGRYLRFADENLKDPHSGFVVLALDCLLAETIEQFRAGATTGKGKSKKYITEFLANPPFQPYFDKEASLHFYEDIRCGLLHQAEAKGMWLVRRGSGTMLQKTGDGRGYIIDVKRFHRAVHEALEGYFQQLVDPAEDKLRIHLWKKMDHICRIRTARGLLYEAGSVSDS